MIWIAPIAGAIFILFVWLVAAQDIAASVARDAES